MVVASRDRCTKFTVTITDNSKAKGTLMINSDDVYLTIGSGTNIGVVGHNGQLGCTLKQFPFDFSSFAQDFQIDFDRDYPGKDARGSNYGLGSVTRDPGNGERWELV